MSLIPVVIGGFTEYDEAGNPFNRTGSAGFMDSNELDRRVFYINNDVEETEIVEYWEGDVIRHRSVNMVLKQGLGIEVVLADMG